MALTVAPDVRIGDSLWTATAWDLVTAVSQVSRGPQTMSVRDVQYLRWTVKVDGDVPQVVSLVVAGSAVVSPPAGALVVPIGHHATYLRITDMPEVIEKQTGWFDVVG